MMMDKQAFLEKVKDVLEIEDRDLAFEDEFKTYEEWDSLAYLSVVGMIAEEYGVVVSAAEVQTLNTLGDMVALVASKQN